MFIATYRTEVGKDPGFVSNMFTYLGRQEATVQLILLLIF